MKLIMKTRQSALGLAALLLAGQASALADGKFFGPVTALGKVEIPDQQALIGYRDGVETLVIDTAFRGGGGEFAWVVPLPAKPRIEPATPGLFATLQAQCAPKVFVQRTPYYAGAIVFGLYLLGVIGSLRAGASVGAVLGVSFLLVLLAPAWLTMASARRQDAGEASVVTLLGQQTMGAFDTVTLSSKDGHAVVDWLNEHGFRAPAGVAPVLTDYAREGGVFVASRLRAAASDEEVRRVHPLAFTFPTPRPSIRCG